MRFAGNNTQKCIVVVCMFTVTASLQSGGQNINESSEARRTARIAEATAATATPSSCKPLIFVTLK